MDLSILDLLPVVSGSSATASLRRAGDLARLGDALGYTRLWYAEHHGMPSIASSVPELMIGHVAAQTERIRLGSGGVMLPNHVPLRVVEQYRTLHALYPGRIDLGIGRAPGTDAMTSRALRATSGHRFPQEMAELLAFAEGTFPSNHAFSAVGATPEGVPLPPIWILGSSGGSAELAGALGLGYAFAGHFSPGPSAPAIALYRASFKNTGRFEAPHVILALNVICAESEEEATLLASSMEMNLLNTFQGGRFTPLVSPEEAKDQGWTPGLRHRLGPMGQKMIVGTLPQVRETIEARAEEAGGVDEIMVTTLTHDPAARHRSYELLAQLMG